MSRNILFECNKLHGFLRMNEFSDNDFAPCVRSKVVDFSTDIKSIPSKNYTIKIVKENTSNCFRKDKNCEECKNFDCLYKDFGLKIKKKILKEDFAEWINEKLIEDPEYIFYFYKYFEADSYGKLIINDNYYTIEAVKENDTNDCLESNTIWRGSGVINSMEYFTDEQISEILEFGKVIKEKMNLYIQSGYSIVMDFAFTTNNYFDNGKFQYTNLLFYGLRTAYNETDINNEYYIPN